MEEKNEGIIYGLSDGCDAWLNRQMNGQKHG